MILTVTPNPCVDKTVFVEEIRLGEFIRSGKYTCIPGGKGTNVSRAVKQLGRETAALVVVGGHTGRHVVDMIENQDGVECIPVWVNSPTRTITTVLETTIHRQTAFFEPGPTLSREDYDKILKTFVEKLHRATVVTFNGTVSDRTACCLYREMISLAHQHGILTILDSHGPELAQGVKAGPYMVKPNMGELEELCGKSLSSDNDVWKATEKLHRNGIRLVVVSRGARELFCSYTDEHLIVTPPRIKEVNPVGSGDALVAGFAIGLSEKMSLEEMAVLGCAAGAANAMSWDIGHFTRDEVLQLAPQVSVKRASSP